MSRIDEAVADLESQRSKGEVSYAKVADSHGVERSTLARRYQGLAASREQKAINQQQLTPEQESTLAEYINRLTHRRLPPTRQMVQNSAAQLAQTKISERWVSRFLHRQKDHLLVKRQDAMDRTHHRADSGAKYKRYFDQLHSKIAEYEVEPRHIYNMDEKGIMIGTLGRSKRIFSRRQWEKREI
ncbi:hypothetical protein EJ07DRAFT_38820, partial [Lizonia empirigonia]